jgi:putative DNA methylase
MTWDFAEANPFLGHRVNLRRRLGSGQSLIALLTAVPGCVTGDAQTTRSPQSLESRFHRPALLRQHRLRRPVGLLLRLAAPLAAPVFPDLFATLAVPKAEELVATPYRHGSKEKAETFFLDGMTEAMHRLAEQAHPAFPVTIYYAFKQAESDGDDGTTNTGWDTFLAAVIEAGFAISGTWPMRTELTTA